MASRLRSILTALADHTDYQHEWWIENIEYEMVFYFILFYFILFYFILFYFILFYFES